MSSRSVRSFAEKGRNISNFSFDASVLEFASTNPAYIFLKHILPRGQNILNHKVRPFLLNYNPMQCCTPQRKDWNIEIKKKIFQTGKFFSIIVENSNL